MKIKNISQVKKLIGKRILVRVDFNVPVKAGKVKDDYKIRRSLPTIIYLLQQGARVVLVSHLGRPKGIEKKLSLLPVAKYIEKMLGEKVYFEKIAKVEDLAGIKRKVFEMPGGSLMMLENIRFLSGEEKNDPKLSKALAGLADMFVLDGFAVAHRDAASVSGVAKHLPSYAGLLLSEELSVLSRVMLKPKRPLVVVLGGAKVETKIPVLKNLLPKADYILVGGAIATTYWWATGKKVGTSLVGKEYKSEIMKFCKNKKVILPVDAVVGYKNGKQAKVVSAEKLEVKGKQTGVYDIGPDTIKLFAGYMRKAQTLIWNGALGMFEVGEYRYGTRAIAQLFATRSRGKAFGVAGGGETVEVLQDMDLAKDIDMVSTGGGAMLEFLGGKDLPGLKNLKKNYLFN